MADGDPEKSGGKRRAIPGTSEAEEQLLAMVTALTRELAVTRERLDTFERLVERAGVVTQADVESFSASESEFEQRQGLRKRIISKVFRPLQETAARDLAKAKAAPRGGAAENTGG